MIYLSNYQFNLLKTHLANAQAELDAIASICVDAKQQVYHPPFDAADHIPLNPISKKELARMLKISSRYLAYQIKLLRPQLREMGIADRARLLPPKAVLLICSSLEIEKMTS